MMMGFGLLMMLAVLAIPILLIAGLVILMMKPGAQRDNPPPDRSPAPPSRADRRPSAGAGRVCSHCGAGLQPEWTHCPQCGAPAE